MQLFPKQTISWKVWQRNYFKAVRMKILFVSEGRRREICELKVTYLWRWDRFEILTPNCAWGKSGEEQERPCLALPGLGTRLVSIHWIPDPSPSTAGEKASINEESSQNKQGLWEIAVDSWWKKKHLSTVELTQYVFSFYLIFKHTKKQCFPTFFT